MLRTRPMAMAIVALLSAGVVYGLWIDRWGLSPEPAASAAKLDQVPEEIGDWESRVNQELDDQSKAIGEIAGYLGRVYGNKQTHREVSCLIVCGRPGAIGAHTPDICFVGQNQEMLRQKRKPVTVGPDEASAEYYTAVFRKTEGGLATFSRAYWMWSAQGTWTAPENPRLSFLGKDALYKLYITHSLREEEISEEEGGPGLEFIKVLIPELDHVLFGKGKREPVAHGHFHSTFAIMK